MTGFLQLPGIACSGVLVMYTLILFAEIYCMIAGVIYKTDFISKLLNILLFVFSGVNMTALCDGFHANLPVCAFTEAVCGLPWAIIFVIIVLQILAVCFSVRRVNVWRKTNITPMSVKQGADRLPTGLCCYDESGRPKLVNHCMESLCRSITGEPLLNANEFWRKLNEGETAPGNTVIDTGPEPIILLKNGDVRLFTRREIISDKRKIFEISAASICEQYELSRKLIAYNSELEEIKRRLVQYSENVADITREKEILAAKIRIHDRLGNALIAARRYIETDGQAVSRQSLLDIWKSNISLLRREAEQPEEDSSLESLYEAAEVMGLSLSIKGDLPKNDSRTMRFIMSGARECMTNAVRHAGASTLFISFSSDRDYHTIEYTNDGVPPTKEISEGGGLSSLRKSVESEGGEMKTESVPNFVLRLKIPKTGGFLHD